MITISPEALAYIKEKGQPIHIKVPPVINCCIDLVDHPSIFTGLPHDIENYIEQNIDGATVYIPADLPKIPLSIEISKFLGIKRLCIEGWKLC